MVDLRQSVYAGTLQGMPEAFQSRVTRELRPGETVRWVTQPRPNAFGGGAIGAFLFAIPWTAFAIF